MDRKRVVITGMGVVAPNGIGLKDFWDSNISGKSGISEISTFDSSMLESGVAGEIKNFNPDQYLDHSFIKKTDRFAQLGLIASEMAVSDSRIDMEREERDRIGIVIGSGLGGVIFHEEQMLIGFKRSMDRLKPLSVPKITPNSVSGNISIKHGIAGENITVSNACASGTMAIGEMYKKIKNGEYSIGIAGGAEAPITEITFAGYSALKVLSTCKEHPSLASRPFDKKRDGFVLSEGSGILILEELKRALERKATIYAEIVGYAANSSAYNMVIPDPSAKDIEFVMKKAMISGGIKPMDINYINAHGTSTVANDKVETLGIKNVFGKSAYKIPISSTKSMIGHSIGASGAIEAIVCAMAIKERVIPPTINLQNKDENCDLDYVPNRCRKVNVDCAMSNSFGFGGSNASIIFRKYEV